MSIQERIDHLKERFNKIDDWDERYKMIIQMGKDLPGLEEQDHSEHLLVKGCQSQVWLKATFDGTVIVFQTDSDASITKGIAAMLTFIYSGATPNEILATKPTYIDDLGIKQHLSMNRANGLASMLKQITIYAMAFKAKQNMTLNHSQHSS